MFEAYWDTVKTSKLDWLILSLGLILVIAHGIGLIGRFQGKRLLFVQNLDSYRTVCLLFTELLPVIGLLGTVLSLMYTFKTFQIADDGEPPDLSQMVRAFAPAMSTTISGLTMIIPNLALNAIIWLVCPRVEKG